VNEVLLQRSRQVGFARDMTYEDKFFGHLSLLRDQHRSMPSNFSTIFSYYFKRARLAKTLLDSIPKDSVSGLRDLALIAAMFSVVRSGSRIGAVGCLPRRL
jgi:hypothetical protein